MLYFILIHSRTDLIFFLGIDASSFVSPLQYRLHESSYEKYTCPYLPHVISRRHRSHNDAESLNILSHDRLRTVLLTPSIKLHIGITHPKQLSAADESG